MAKKTGIEEPVETLEAEKKYTKAQILRAKKYQWCYDFLNGNLKANRKYTLSEVDKMIDDYYNKEVH